MSQVLRRFLPGVHQKFTRSITMPRTTTVTSMRSGTERARAVPYVSFDAVVGHNSSFISLTEEQLEELGGVEFRALNALLWIVGIVCYLLTFVSLGLIHPLEQYHISVQLLSFTIIASYISSNKWKNNFRPPQLQRPISAAWYVLSEQAVL